MTDEVLYEDTTRHPLLASVRLTATELKMSDRRMPAKELNAVAMAEACLRGRWLGGG